MWKQSWTPMIVSEWDVVGGTAGMECGRDTVGWGWTEGSHTLQVGWRVGWKGWKKSSRKVNQELHLKTNENPEKAHQKSTRRSKSIEAHSKPTQSPHQQNLNKKDYQMPTKSLHRQEPTKSLHEPPPAWHKDTKRTIQQNGQWNANLTRSPPNAHQMPTARRINKKMA